MHKIIFDQVETGWHNALPLGNGRMGAMVFFRDNTIHLALNHYDCYYQNLYTRRKQTEKVPGERYRQLCEIAENARHQKEVERSHYNQTLRPETGKKRPQFEGTSHPMGGEVLFGLSEEMRGAKTNLQLIIEKAAVVFTAEKGENKVTMTICVPPDAEGVLIQAEQSKSGLYEQADLILPSARGLDQYPVEWGVEGESKWMHTTLYHEDDHSQAFAPETALTVPGSKAAAGALSLSVLGTVFSASASVRPDRGMAFQENKHILEDAKVLLTGHERFWNEYWRSHVKLPDDFLETLWYLHLYLIGCHSGRGGKYFEQACGLSGLWDIRRPCNWGSMWYWDVNIEEAFWQTYAANHLELAEEFCEGYLKHAEKIRAYTKEVYGIDDGWAIDYPHNLYNCIQPWCALFLWNYYAYSLDRTFLEEKAYPVFLKQISFVEQIAKREADGTWHMDPDISPEQGPLTRDSVITIASIRQMARYALQAAHILDRPQEEKDRIETLLAHLPAYPLTEDKKRWKDSYLAPDDLPLRHPSILMPIFPAEEITKDSGDAVWNTAFETLRYAASHTELGVFGFGWIAAAAARMGAGGSALRILYEQGIDLCIHSNGMGYEETERWFNHCIMTKIPVYWPAMTEPSGGIVGAVDEMLLQSVNGVIEVFPALPDGTDPLLPKKEGYLQYDKDRYGVYPVWEDCSFDGLLAQGGVIVSAQRRHGKTVWMKLESPHGGRLVCRIPGSLSKSGSEERLERKMEPGEVLELGKKEPEREEGCRGCERVQMREAAGNHRRIFLGENKLTAYYKAVDAFVCSFGFANDRRPQWTAYVFDFGQNQQQKTYDNSYRSETCEMGGHVMTFTGPRPWDDREYRPDRGYGFARREGLAIRDRDVDDDLRRDFVEGEAENEFWMELPKGKYDLLVISGDEEEMSQTAVDLPQYGTRAGGAVMESGRYQCVTIPFVHTEDGIFRVRLRTGEGKRWKLNALFLNKDYVLV